MLWRWLQKVFWVMGGYITTTGLQTKPERVRTTAWELARREWPGWCPGMMKSS